MDREENPNTLYALPVVCGSTDCYFNGPSDNCKTRTHVVDLGPSTKWPRFASVKHQGS